MSHTPTIPMDYAHQITRDNGRNKPFETRIVQVSGVHYHPSFEMPFDCFVVRCEAGEFSGMEAGGDSWEDALTMLRIQLSDASRKAFEKQDGYTLKGGVSVPLSSLAQ